MLVRASLSSTVASFALALDGKTDFANSFDGVEQGKSPKSLCQALQQRRYCWRWLGAL